MQEKTR